jgi:hypothetical protein
VFWCTSERSHLLDTNTSFYNSPRTNRPMVILTRLDRISLAASCPNSVRRCKFEGQSGRFFQRFQSKSVWAVTHIKQVQLGKHKTLKRCPKLQVSCKRSYRTVRTTKSISVQFSEWRNNTHTALQPKLRVYSRTSTSH